MEIHRQYMNVEEIIKGQLKKRGQIYRTDSTEADNIYFTSGGTESDNWALEAAVAGKHGGTIIVSGIEHPAILK